jgi:hypothetical protein
MYPHDHLPVAEKTYTGADGHIYGCGWQGVHRIGGANWTRYSFYVDQAGILRSRAKLRLEYKREQSAKRTAKSVDRIPASGNCTYVKENGIWYLETKSVLTYTYRHPAIDPVTGEKNSKLDTVDKIIVRKKQLNKKELKQLCQMQLTVSTRTR